VEFSRTVHNATMEKHQTSLPLAVFGMCIDLKAPRIDLWELRWKVQCSEPAADGIGALNGAALRGHSGGQGLDV
jgi:hypothetical protein